MSLVELSLEAVKQKISRSDDPREVILSLPNDLIRKLFEPPKLFGSTSLLTQPIVETGGTRESMYHVRGALFSFEELIPIMKRYGIAIPEDPDELVDYRFDLLEELDNCICGLKPETRLSAWSALDCYRYEFASLGREEAETDFKALSIEEKKRYKAKLPEIKELCQQNVNHKNASWIRVFQYPCCYPDLLKDKRYIIIGILLKQKKWEYTSDILIEMVGKHVTPARLSEYLLGNLACVPSEEWLKLEHLMHDFGFAERVIADYLVPDDCYSCS